MRNAGADIAGGTTTGQSGRNSPSRRHETTRQSPRKDALLFADKFVWLSDNPHPPDPFIQGLRGSDNPATARLPLYSGQNSMTTIEQIARFATSANPGSGLIARVGPAMVDCFGCILAGADSEVAQRVSSALAPFGAGSAPLYGRARTLSAPYAAMVNAVAGHAWDLDDWEEPGNTHPTVVLLPALLATAHLRTASGADLCAAYAVGAEIIMRLGEALTLDHYARGFHSTRRWNCWPPCRKMLKASGL